MGYTLDPAGTGLYRVECSCQWLSEPLHPTAAKDWRCPRGEQEAANARAEAAARFHAERRAQAEQAAAWRAEAARRDRRTSIAAGWWVAFIMVIGPLLLWLAGHWYWSNHRQPVGIVCSDGWVSNSNGGPGTCSHHGGIGD